MKSIDYCCFIQTIILGGDFLDIDPLATRYHFFYQFNNLFEITKKHLELLPESRRPSRL